MAQLKKWLFSEKYHELVLYLQDLKHQIKIQEQVQTTLHKRISTLEMFDDIQ